MLSKSQPLYTDASTNCTGKLAMEIEALPSFNLTFEGYCQAVSAYAATANPYILRWITVVNSMLTSGELAWEPAQTTEEKLNRLQAMRNAANALNLFSNQMQQRRRGRPTWD